MEHKGQPFVEKYRPNNFKDIVLEETNKRIFTNIINTNYFPNLLFYGPPGTGKTTTIINIIKTYQEKNNQKNKELMIHLNASDERGIDIIRNQISQFVKSKTLFKQGMKFVILDEVDYMTKSAQQALRNLLQDFSCSVRFCLICNYISRIDESLQNDFLRIRFNQLPKNEINRFLTNISANENINITERSITFIQKKYKSDIRSMINFIQTNQDINDNELHIINDSVWEELYIQVKEKKELKQQREFINEISKKYNIDHKTIVNDFFNYLIRNKEELITSNFLKIAENIIHFENYQINNMLNYVLVKLSRIIIDN